MRMATHWMSLLLCAVVLGCSHEPSNESAAAPRVPRVDERTARVDERTPRAVLLDAVAFGTERWCQLEVKQSLVTGTRRRIHFDKDAAVQALLNWRGGSGATAALMPWPVGTIFVAESLDAEGHALDTEVLLVRSGTPDFRLFDEAGNESHTFRQPGDSPGGPRQRNVPVVCAGCHNGTGFFPPMTNFPTEPAVHEMTVSEGARDILVINKFLEGFHRSGGTFGPYASILLGQLRAGMAAGRLTAADKARAAALQPRYPDLLATPR